MFIKIYLQKYFTTKIKKNFYKKLDLDLETIDTYLTFDSLKSSKVYFFLSKFIIIFNE